MDMMTRCLVCNDANHFEMKVCDARRIEQNLERILSEHKNVESDINLARTLFSFDRQHQHFLCGRCHKVDESRLKREEDKIDLLLSKICNLIKSNDFDHSKLMEVLHNLQGHYPGKYKALEKFYYQNK